MHNNTNANNWHCAAGGSPSSCSRWMRSLGAAAGRNKHKTNGDDNNNDNNNSNKTTTTTTTSTTSTTSTTTSTTTTNNNNSSSPGAAAGGSGRGTRRFARSSRRAPAPPNKTSLFYQYMHMYIHINK